MRLILIFALILLGACDKKKKEDSSFEINLRSNANNNSYFEDVVYRKSFDKKIENDLVKSGFKFTKDVFMTPNSAIFFDGNAYEDPTDFELTNNFSISFWVKPKENNKSSFTPIIVRPLDEGFKEPFYQFLFGVRGSNYKESPYTFIFWLSVNNELQKCSSIINWVVDEWYHIAATYNGSLIKFYINGKLQTQKYVEGNVVSSKNKIFFGKHHRYDFIYLGALDEFQIYDRTLSNEEIRLLYE